MEKSLRGGLSVPRRLEMRWRRVKPCFSHNSAAKHATKVLMAPKENTCCKELDTQGPGAVGSQKR